MFQHAAYAIDDCRQCDGSWRVQIPVHLESRPAEIEHGIAIGLVDFDSNVQVSSVVHPFLGIELAELSGAGISVRDFFHQIPNTLFSCIL